MSRFDISCRQSDIFTFLAASVLVVPLSRTLNITPVLGFLVLGCAIGPYGLSLFSNSEADTLLGDFGIVFLLFIEGLQLSPDRLQKLGGFFKLGLAQFLLTIAAITAANLYLGPQILPLAERLIPLDDSIVRPILTTPVLAFCLAGAGALSSSAFVLPVLKQKGWEERPEGTAALAVLLLQDLAVAPLLVVLPLLAGAGPQSSADLGVLVAKGTIGFGGVLVVGSVVLRQIFKTVAAAQSSETFVAAALLVAIGMGMAAEELGLSTTTGAFAAGVLLAGSPYRQQIEADIKPFEGILLGIFFMTAGANLDPALCVTEWPTLLSGILAFLGAKVAILFAAGAISFGLTRAEAIRIAILLAGGGEFAFIVFKLASDLGLLPDRLANLLTASVIISMSLTPVLGEMAGYVGTAVERIDATSAANAQADELFDLIDADGNGSIDFDELKEYLLGAGRDTMGGGGLADGVGAAGGSGATDALQNETPSFALRVGELFETLDQNGDGVITREELSQGYLGLMMNDVRDAAVQYAAAGAGAPPSDDTNSAMVVTAPDAVVVCGYGEMGQRVCDVLADAEGVGGGAGADELRDVVALPSGSWGSEFLAFDRNPSRVSVGVAKKVRVVYGDGAAPELLRAAGVPEPRAIVITYANDKRCLEATRRLREAFPEVSIIVRARTEPEAEPLLQAGATEVVVEAVESAVRVASLLGAAGRPKAPSPWPIATTAAAAAIEGGGELRGVVVSSAAPAAAMPPFPRDQLESLATECGISLTQLRELYDGFETLEANADGEVELDAIRDMLMRVSLTQIDDEALRAWMVEADSDGNSSISFFEYVRVDTRLSAERGRASLPAISS